MLEADWLAATDVLALLRHVTPTASDRKNGLYLCGGCYRIAHLFHDPRNSLPAVEVGERHADGRATDKEVSRANWFSESPTFGFDFDPDFVARLDATDRADLTRRLVAAGALDEAAFANGVWRVDEAVRDRLLAAAELAYNCCPGPPQFERGLFNYMARVPWPGRWLVDCVFGDPFRPAAADPAWLTPTAAAVARTIYDGKTFHDLPVLADALEDAGCDHAPLLARCRGGGDHARGCWAVDLVLGLR